MDSFKIGNDEYSFEIVVPYTRRSLQVLHEEPLRVEDLFHRTVRITRTRDGRSWTGAADFKNLSINDLSTYLKRWLPDCFARWSPDQVPDDFEIPQGEAPASPAIHHCREFPAVSPLPPPEKEEIVDTASDDSFPASDPPEWTGVRIE